VDQLNRWPALPISLLLELLLISAVGCGIAQSASAKSATAAGSSSSANQVVVWGEVPATPSCACDHPDYLGRVSRGLAEIHLDQNFTTRDVSGPWQRFTVTFDPRQVPTKQVVQMIADRGGQVLSVSNAASAREPGPNATPCPPKSC